MMRQLLASLALMALVVTQSAAQSAKPPGFEAELKSIKSEYQQNMQAFYKSLEKADGAEWTKAMRDPNRNPTKKSVDKLTDLAERAKGTPVCVQSKVFAMQIARQADMNDVYDRLLKDCIANHLTSPDMESVASMIGYGRSTEQKAEAQKTLKLIEEKSPHHGVQAAAINAQMSQCYDSYSGTGDADAAKGFAQRLAKDYADTQYGKRAPNLIFQIDNLSVGKTAPEIEGEDQDGVKFKLSDYRGKVVVIDFWGWW